MLEWCHRGPQIYSILVDFRDFIDFIDFTKFECAINFQINDRIFSLKILGKKWWINTTSFTKMHSAIFLFFCMIIGTKCNQSNTETHESTTDLFGTFLKETQKIDEINLNINHYTILGILYFIVYSLIFGSITLIIHKIQNKKNNKALTPERTSIIKRISPRKNQNTLCEYRIF